MAITTFPARGLNRMVATETDKLSPAFRRSAPETEGGAFGSPAPEDAEAFEPPVGTSTANADGAAADDS